MKQYKVGIELHGEQIHAGDILFNTQDDAAFSYTEEYLDRSDARAISLSLPLQNGTEPFTAKQTKNFFSGLLPEGFTRRAVAAWMHVDEGDYLSLLYGLGQECLGAISISDGSENITSDSYERLSMERVKELAAEGASKASEIVIETHLSLAGATGKVGLYYDGDRGEWYLPIGNAPSTHIVKQSHVRLDGIVVNEKLCLLAAHKLGINVPESFIINTGDSGSDVRDRDILFATKRYDRVVNDNARSLSGMKKPFRLHQEDFAQAMGIPSSEKYEHYHEGYLRSMFDILRKYSADPIADQTELWKVLMLDLLLGNTDNHIKNSSLLYSPRMDQIRLAPAYDMVSTVIYGTSTRQMAVNVGGEYDINKVNESNIMACADEVGIGKKLAMRYFYELRDNYENALSEAARELKDEGINTAEDICERILKRTMKQDR